jgi:hypothetical protein
MSEARICAHGRQMAICGECFPSPPSPPAPEAPLQHCPLKHPALSDGFAWTNHTSTGCVATHSMSGEQSLWEHAAPSTQQGEGERRRGVRVDRSREWWMEKARAEGDSTPEAGALPPEPTQEARSPEPPKYPVGRVGALICPACWCVVWCGCPHHDEPPPHPEAPATTDEGAAKALARKLGYAEPYDGGTRWVYDDDALPVIAEALRAAESRAREGGRERIEALEKAIGRYFAANDAVEPHELACAYCSGPGRGCVWPGWLELEVAEANLRAALSAPAQEPKDYRISPDPREDEF